jgi:hypothetical protein
MLTAGALGHGICHPRQHPVPPQRRAGAAALDTPQKRLLSSKTISRDEAPKAHPSRFVSGRGGTTATRGRKARIGVMSRSSETAGVPGNGSAPSVVEPFRRMLRDSYRLLRRRSFLAVPLAAADLFLRPNGFVRQSGWLQTYRARLPVTDAGPVPWMTFPAIGFLESRLRADFRVFEYGAGYSTLWWARRVASVVTCEHDEQWVETMRYLIPPNVSMIHRPLEVGGAYAREAAHHTVDIIVIDGRDRINCARFCLPGLSPGGVIVWDNTDRESYAEGYAFLDENGFRCLDFTGIGPVNITTWCTSVFYRRENCLGI